jgi:hypothetical protein
MTVRSEFKRVSMGNFHGRRCDALAISTAFSQGIAFSGLSASLRRQIRVLKVFEINADMETDSTALITFSASTRR